MVVAVEGSSGPLEDVGELVASTNGAALPDVDGLDVVEAQGVLGDRVGDAEGVDVVGIVVEVVDVVTNLVVVDVVGDTGLAAEELGLLVGLETLGTGEETAGGDAVLDEGGVVGAAAELGGDVVDAVAVVELLEVLLNDVGAGGTGQVEGVAITVVDAEHVVGRGDLETVSMDAAKMWVQGEWTYHVEVEVGTDLGELGVRAVEGVDVEVRAQQTVLLGTPEGEADSVLDLEVGKAEGDVQDADDAGAVVTVDRLAVARFVMLRYKGGKCGSTHLMPGPAVTESV